MACCSPRWVGPGGGLPTGRTLGTRAAAKLQRCDSAGEVESPVTWGDAVQAVKIAKAEPDSHRQSPINQLMYVIR
jgi:hypothetical protein